MSTPTVGPDPQESSLEPAVHDKALVPHEEHSALPVRAEPPPLLPPAASKAVAWVRGWLSGILGGRQNGHKEIVKSTREGKDKGKPEKTAPSWSLRDTLKWKAAAIFLKLGVSFAFICLLLVITNITSFKSGVLGSVDKKLGVVEDRMDSLDSSSPFLGDAYRKAEAYAFQCFTFTNDRTRNHAKRLEAIGGPSTCGWNGKGNGTALHTLIAENARLVSSDRQRVIVAVELQVYGSHAYFDFFIPFKRDENGQAAFDGQGSIFGPNAGAEDMSAVEDSCNGSSLPDKKLEATIQTFMDALAGTSVINIDYLLAEGASFGGFATAGSSPVSDPKVVNIEACEQQGSTMGLTALVRFTGPGRDGATFTFPYAFVVTKVESGKKEVFKVNNFGPAPWIEGGGQDA